MKQSILITGGAGYIGSHTVLELLHHNYHVFVIDKACSHTINHPNVTYFQCDIADTRLVKSICTTHAIDAVIHCAGSIEVGASVTNPAAYYDNNVLKTVALFETLRACMIEKIIFSSSAAVYGIPETERLRESDPCKPINPYGKTKYIIEELLADYGHAYGIRSVALRYFNVAGAWPECGLGERHEPETHLIPRILQAAVHSTPITLFGTDYSTPDGTCIRDYIHVRDIARAHRHALEYMHHNADNQVINLGAGTGYSVREIISTVEQVVGKKIALTVCPRRAGDPAYLVADISRAHDILNWQPQYSDLHTMIQSAYDFMMQKNSARKTQVLTFADHP